MWQAHVPQVRVSLVGLENQVLPMHPAVAAAQGVLAVRVHKPMALIPVHGVVREVLALLRQSPAPRLSTVVAVVAVYMA
jgi:hypothetical protein